jgi:hypothetical protein
MPATAALSHGTWSALGVFEVVCGTLVVVPAVMKWMPMLTPLAAGALVIESLGLAVVYSRYSRALAATNPLLWVVAIALMGVIVAFGRSPSRLSA